MPRIRRHWRNWLSLATVQLRESESVSEATNWGLSPCGFLVIRKHCTRAFCRKWGSGNSMNLKHRDVGLLLTPPLTGW